MKSYSRYWPVYHKYHLRQVAQTLIILTPGQSNPGETKTMEATTPELGPIRFWSPKSSSFSSSDSISRRSCKKLSKSTANKSGAPNFFYSAEDSKLRRCLETFGRDLEQFLQLQTSSNNSIIFLLGMPFDRLDKKSIQSVKWR